jgi:hypothetical protein
MPVVGWCAISSSCQLRIRPFQWIREHSPRRPAWY